MKTTKLYLFLTLLLTSCFLTPPLYGQRIKGHIPTAYELKKKTKKQDLCTVTGLVIDDKTGKPLPYVTVGFGLAPAFMLPDLYAITDEEGRFSYQLPAGIYGIMVSCVGYQYRLKYPITLEDPKKPVEVETFSMVEKPVTLDEVLVKPLVDVSSSEITYNLAQDPDREIMNLHEILDKVPMVERTPDGRLYVDNPDTPFLIVRNGREDALFGNKEMIDQTLKALPAKAFQKVTLKLMPESRYGDYKYVLSIDADEVNRLYGVVNQNYDTYNANNGELRLTSSIMTSFDRLRMNAGGDFRNVNSPETEQTLTQAFHDDGSALAQDGRTHRNGESFGGSAMASYDLGTQHFVTARIAYSNTRNRNYEDLTVNNITPEGTSAYASWTKNRNTGYSLNGYVNYQYDFAKPNRVLNIVYNFAHNPGKQDNDMRFTGDYDPAIVPPWQQGRSRNEQHTVQAHFSDPLSKAFMLETGLGYIFRDYRTTSRYADNEGRELPESYYAMESEKHLMNAYLNLRYTSKLVSGSVSLKGEYLNDGHGTHIDQGTDAPEYISQTGFAFTPNAQVSFLLRDKWIDRIGITYRWTKQRPNIRMMSTQADYSNPNYIRTGNPALDDEDRHHLGFDLHVKKGPNISLYGQYSGNDIAPYYYTDEQGRVVNTYANNGTYRAAGLNALYLFPFKKFSLTTMLNELYSYTRTAGQRTECLQTNLSMQASFFVGKGGSLNLAANYTDFRFSGTSSNTMHPFSLRIFTRWSLFKGRMELEAGCSNVTNFRFKTEQELHTAAFDQHMIVRTKAVPVYIRLNWRIGNFQVKPVRQARQGAIIDDVITE